MGKVKEAAIDLRNASGLLRATNAEQSIRRILHYYFGGSSDLIDDIRVEKAAAEIIDTIEAKMMGHL